MFFSLKHDILLITDSRRSAGIIAGDPTAESGTVASSGYVKVLAKALFGSGDVESVEDTESEIVRVGRFGRGASGASGKAREVLAKTPGIVVTSRRLRSHPVSTRTLDQGFLPVSGKRMWHPAGKLTERRIGSRVARLVEGTERFDDRIQVDRGIALTGITTAGPVLVAAGSGCGVCGACGVCGGCVLCAEVNYAAAVASAAAAAAVSSVSNSFTFDPGPQLDEPEGVDIDRFRLQRQVQLQNLQRRLQLIQEQADDVGG